MEGRDFWLFFFFFPHTTKAYKDLRISFLSFPLRRLTFAFFFVCFQAPAYLQTNMSYNEKFPITRRIRFQRKIPRPKKNKTTLTESLSFVFFPLFRNVKQLHKTLNSGGLRNTTRRRCRRSFFSSFSFSPWRISLECLVKRHTHTHSCGHHRIHTHTEQLAL